MKQNRSIQKSWDKLESYFKAPAIPRSTSIKPKSFRTSESFTRCTSQSRPRFRNPSLSSVSIEGVSQNKIEKLYQAKCKDLQIPPKSDHKSKFFLYCSTHFSVKTLKLVDYKLGPNAAQVVGDILKTNKVYAYVKLGKNCFGDEGVTSIIKGIVFNTTIVHLDLSNNNISQEGCYFILKTLKRHPSLSSLSLASESALNRNKIGKIGAVELERFMTGNEIVGVLNLYSTMLLEGVNELAEGIKASKSLVSLNIGANQLGALELKTISNVIPISRLLILNLSDNFISNEGSASISFILTENSQLEQLYVSGNNIGQKGAKLIFTALYSNFSLKKLDLSNNPIKTLFEDTSYALENNYCLKDLNLADCSLNYSSILLLSHILLKNKGLTSLNLACNSLDDKGILPICRVLTKNFIIKTLNLSRNKIRNEGAKSLSEVLMNNQGIVEVNLRENEIKDSGAEELSEAARVNMNILRVGLELNMVGAKYLQKIGKYLKLNNGNQTKIEPTRVKQQMAKLVYNKNSLSNIINKSEETAKEKEDLLLRVTKQNERYEETLQKENGKYSKLHKQYLELKNTNFELSKEIENIEIEKIVFIKQKLINSKNLEKSLLEKQIGVINKAILKGSEMSNF